MLARRRLLKAAGFGAIAAAMPPSSNAAATNAPIQQPANPGPRAFMDRAVALRDRAVAAGDQPYGAVVVKDGKIVGEGPSRVISNSDPTAHAEMEAIRDAARRLGTNDLSGCVLYGTSKACAMCETGSYWARLDKLIYGTALADGGGPRYGGCS